VRTIHGLLVVAAAVLVIAAAAPPGRAEAPKVGVSLTCADARAVEKYRAYVAFIASDPARFERELATLKRLEASDVQYVIRIGGELEPGVEGSLSTDGERVVVSVSNEGGVYGEVASLNSRLAHELEHARQFDEGEIAFGRDARTGRWQPVYTSYDIGDEIKAWEAQLRASTPKDFWRVTDRKRKATLLQLFAEAGSDTARGELLARSGYGNRNPVAESDVVFPETAGFAAGQVIRPTEGRAFFGRVRRVSHPVA
jgi:hypothetical protein